MGLNPQVRAIRQSEGGGRNAERRPSPMVVSCWPAAERRRRRTAKVEERQGACVWVSGPLWLHGRAGGLDGFGLGWSARLLIGSGRERGSLREEVVEWRFRCEMVEVSWPVVPRHGYDWRLAMWAARGWNTGGRRRRSWKKAGLSPLWCLVTRVGVQQDTRWDALAARGGGRAQHATGECEAKVGTLGKAVADRRMGVLVVAAHRRPSGQNRVDIESPRLRLAGTRAPARQGSRAC